MPAKVHKSESEWAKTLTPAQYHILREKGTERPFTGTYVDFHGKGVFNCAACGSPLFHSDKKYESGSGWPSFWEPLEGQVHEREDTSHGMVRREVLCSTCDSHLGHVFDDGPPPTGKRYCINSAALAFAGESEPDMD